MLKTEQQTAVAALREKLKRIQQVEAELCITVPGRMPSLSALADDQCDTSGEVDIVQDKSASTGPTARATSKHPDVCHDQSKDPRISANRNRHRSSPGPDSSVNTMRPSIQRGNPVKHVGRTPSESKAIVQFCRFHDICKTCRQSGHRHTACYYQYDPLPFAYPRNWDELFWVEQSDQSVLDRRALKRARY